MSYIKKVEAKKNSLAFISDDLFNQRNFIAKTMKEIATQVSNMPMPDRDSRRYEEDKKLYNLHAKRSEAALSTITKQLDKIQAAIVAYNKEY